MEENYIALNKSTWNSKVDFHVNSDFYDMPTFLAGNSSLNEIETPLLGDLKGKKVLHLQCHFGQDTLSMARMGAKCTGVDLSDKAISKAQELNEQLKLDAQFICCDLFDIENHLEGEFDVVFASYGTIGWLPDINKWASIVNKYLKKGGKFVFAEFHPIVWMFDDDFKTVAYPYNNQKALVETYEGTYAQKDAKISNTAVMWHHGLAEVISALNNQGLSLKEFNEFNYSPYSCFNGLKEIEPGKHIIEKFEGRIPMVYSLLYIK